MPRFRLVIAVVAVTSFACSSSDAPPSPSSTGEDAPDAAACAACYDGGADTASGDSGRGDGGVFDGGRADGGSTDGGADAAPPTGLRVVGYYPDYADRPPSALPYDKLTHINYAFASVRTDGTLDTATSMLQDVTTRAHAAGVKVLISVGGGDADINAVMKDTNLRANVIANVEQLVSTYHLDGVDIDWEGFDSSCTSAYTALMKTLSMDLHAQGKIVTTALDTGTWFGMNVASAAFAYIDQLNIMAYDGDNPHSPYQLAVNGIDYWAGRGYPKQQMNIGVPFYGRLDSNWNTEISYKALIAKSSSAANLDDYAGYNYNGMATIAKKTKLAMSQTGGIMIWDINQDTVDPYSLLSTIHATLAGH